MLPAQRLIQTSGRILLQQSFGNDLPHKRSHGILEQSAMQSPELIKQAELSSSTILQRELVGLPSHQV